MGGMSLIHWLLVGAVVLILFGGKGKISDIMGDVAKGVKAFKKGLADDEPAAPAAGRRDAAHDRASGDDAGGCFARRQQGQLTSFFGLFSESFVDPERFDVAFPSGDRRGSRLPARLRCSISMWANCC